jgi:UDP-N-acetylglucosamine--N-acetylmuramyl-(pentapeptide) pyrophosphoryl-undecaprenol N-acetylglucosamine transferase
VGGPEERLVPAAGFELVTIKVRGLDRDAVWKNLALPAVIPAALRAGLGIVDRFMPDVVLGMGGYVMAPAVAAARIRGVPYVLHEKDVRPGLATRMFAGAAAAICTTLPGTEKRIHNHRVVLTGVPLREGFEPRTPAVPPRRLLITGGSQGARNLNQAVWGALDQLCERSMRSCTSPGGRVPWVSSSTHTRGIAGSHSLTAWRSSCHAPTWS